VVGLVHAPPDIVHDRRRAEQVEGRGVQPVEVAGEVEKGGGDPEDPVLVRQGLDVLGCPAGDGA
jgi:hypothetical protein